MNIGERIPPQALDVERTVLASMLLDEDARSRALELTSPSFFYATANRFVYEAIQSLSEAGSPVEVPSVADELERAGRLQGAGDTPYLASLVSDMASTVTGIDHYVAILREKVTARRLILVAQQTMDDAFTGQDIQRTLRRAEKGIYSASEVVVSSELVNIMDAASEMVQELENIYTGKRTGVPIGLYRIDEETGGLQKSDLVVLAGRPSMGKTALALQIALTAAKSNHKVAIFSLEMSRTQIMQRMTAMEGKLDLFMLRTGRLGDAGLPKVSSILGPLTDLPIWIDDNPDVSAQQIRAKCRRMRGLGLVVIDYLQLMDGEGRTLREQVANNSRALKKMAKALDIPVLALSQLSRANEAQGRIRRPRLSDLRESGNIEQDADVVIFCHRPEMYKRTSENEGQAEIIIGKQRNGPAGIAIHVGFHKKFTLFHNANEDPEDKDPGDVRRWDTD